MRSSVLESVTFWRCIFLAHELVLVSAAAWCYWRLPSPASYLPSWMCDLLTLVVAESWLFLLIVSPLYLRSQRLVALVGWVLAFGSMFLLAVRERNL